MSLTLSLAAPLAAQNLLSNPDFSGGLEGWEYAPEEISYSAADAGEAPGSGSARTQGPLALALQFVQVLPLTAYDLGGRVRAENIGEDGTSRVAVDWYSDDRCITYIATASTAPLMSATGPFGVWVPLYASAESPAGASCAQVVIQLQAGGQTSFDGIVFAPAGTAPLPLFVNGFGSGTSDGWSDAVP